MSDNTYTAVARRIGDWWAISVPALKGVHTQVKRLPKAEAMARDAIALFLGVNPKDVTVQVVPDLPDEVAAARDARQRASQAEADAEKATARAVAALISNGWTVRDAGEVIGISAQRVSQISNGTSRQVATG